MSEELALAVRRALRTGTWAFRDRPFSDRALCRAAGIPPSTLSRIQSGERGATREVTEALADALARLTAECCQAERTLRRALQEEEDR